MLLACLPYRFIFSFSISLTSKMSTKRPAGQLDQVCGPRKLLSFAEERTQEGSRSSKFSRPSRKTNKDKRGCLSPKNRKLNILFENHTELSKLLFSLHTCCKLCLYVWSRLTSAPFGTSNDAHANRRAPTALRGDVRRGRLDR